jgi:hypothetical protein
MKGLRVDESAEDDERRLLLLRAKVGGVKAEAVLERTRRTRRVAIICFIRTIRANAKEVGLELIKGREGVEEEETTANSW